MSTALSHANRESQVIFRRVATWLRQSGWIERLKQVIALRVPLGYEDSDGFHVGAEPITFTASNEFDQPETNI